MISISIAVALKKSNLFDKDRNESFSN